MSNFPGTYAISGPDNTPMVFNTGVTRIPGAQLKASGYVINWLYLIIDIGCLATYENQGRDVWLGADGIAVAGNTAVLNALVPLEGQRFFNVETNQPVQYKGGAWGGATWADFSSLSPSTIVLTNDAQLVPQREYIVNSDNKIYNLPSDVVGNNGHLVRVYCAPGSENNVIVPTGSTELVEVGGGSIAQMELVEGRVYDFVYLDASWLAFSESAITYLRTRNNLSDLPDKAVSRANLEVYSAPETRSVANNIVVSGAGLTEAGSPSLTSQKVITINYATPAEILDGNVEKPIQPAGLQATFTQVVQQAQQANKFNNFTGLTNTSSTFYLSSLDGSSIEYPGFSVVFNLDPALRSTDLIAYDVVGGALTLPAGAGYQILQVICNVSGVVVLEAYETVANPSKCLLGIAYCLNGLVTHLVACPNITGSDYYLRSAQRKIVSGSIAPAAFGRLTATGLVIFGEAENWADKVPDLNYRTIANIAMANLTYYRGTNVILSTGNVVDGRTLNNGTTVPSGEFSVQTVYVTTAGQLFIAVGATTYTTMAAAVAAAGTEQASKLAAYAPLLTEMCRLVIKGDQFVGSAVLDITDSSKCRVIPTSSLLLGGSSSAGTGESGFSRITSASILQYNKRYRFETSELITLPLGGQEGGWIEWITSVGFEPNLRVNNVATETIVNCSRANDVDTVLIADNRSSVQSVQWLNGAWRY